MRYLVFRAALPPCLAGGAVEGVPFSDPPPDPPPDGAAAGFVTLCLAAPVDLAATFFLWQENTVIYDFILGTGKKDLNEFSKTKIIQLLTAVKELMREDSINMQVERLEVKVVEPFQSYGTVVKLKRVERLEVKVVEPFQSYGTVVKLKREDLKATLSARNREAKQMQQLDRMRQRNPSDRQIIAESELQSATMNATRTTRPLEEAIDEFEKQKIRDIKDNARPHSAVYPEADQVYASTLLGLFMVRDVTPDNNFVMFSY
ncbi:UNVERIFIED_CONTAM: hypothetical protein FKN15_062950 [Acipenser sinensis]